MIAVALLGPWSVFTNGIVFLFLVSKEIKKLSGAVVVLSILVALVNDSQEGMFKAKSQLFGTLF